MVRGIAAAIQLAGEHREISRYWPPCRGSARVRLLSGRLATIDIILPVNFF